MLDLIDETLAQNLAARRGPFLLMLSRWTRNMQRPARSRHHLGPYLETLLARPANMRALAAEGITAPLV